MTTLHVYAAGTDDLVDTITVTESGEVDYATGTARPTLETLTEQYNARGIRLSVDQVAEALDGWSDGTVELFAPDEMVDLREALGSDGTDLKLYWTKGKGAGKIKWGTDNDFNRCVRHLRKYVDDPKGLCNTYHQAAVGAPPGKGH